MVVPARTDRDYRPEDFDDDEDSSPFEDDSHEQEYDESDDTDSDDEDSDGSTASGDSTREVENSPSLTPEQLQQEIERYKARLNGANRKIQELSQGRTALETQWQQERAQYLEALMRERIQDLPPEEQDQQMQMFYHALQAEQEKSQHQQERQLYGEVARRATVMDIARRYADYGVTEEKLMQFDSANEMIAHAEERKSWVEEQQQTQKRQRRRRKKADNFEEPRQSSTPRKEPQTLDEAEAEFRRQYRTAQRRR